MEAIIAAIVPIVIAVTEFIKKALNLTGNTVIIVTLLVGGVVGAILKYTTYHTQTLPLMILFGVIAGGIAAGLWKSGASLIKKANSNNGETK